MTPLDLILWAFTALVVLVLVLVGAVLVAAATSAMRDMRNGRS